jgi:hypothetical protein
MALVYVGANSTPNYTCLSTDIVVETGQVIGAIRKGATVFVVDSAIWKIVDDDLVLQPYNVPAAITVENVTIDAAIAIDQTTDGSTNKTIVGTTLGAGATIGATTDAVVITDAAGTLSSKLRGLVKWAFERMPASLGQKSKAASLPVVIASDQDTLVVSGTVTSNAGTNLNTSALALETGGNLAEIKTNTDNIPAVGQAAMAASMPVTMASDQSDLVVVPHNLADEIIVTPTLTIAATYVSGDYVGTSTTPMTFSNCARVNGGTGTIAGVALVDSNVASVAGELWLFDAPITTPNDSAAWAISGADALKCIGVIPFSTYYSGGNASVTFAEKQGIVFKTESDSRSLYGAFVTRGAPTYATGSLTFKLRVWQD